MTVASGTATTAELVTLYLAASKLAIALEMPYNGSGKGGNPAAPGRFTAAQVDTLISAVSAAITAVNA